MTSPFHVAYRDQLLAAAERQIRYERQRRRRRVRAVVAGALATVIGSMALLVLPDPAGADVEVQVVDGYLEVSIRGSGATRDEVLEALQDHDIDASVAAVATGPSAVGQFTAVYAEMGSGPIQADVLGPAGPGFGGFRIREDMASRLVIELGRPAQPGEPYAAFTFAFDKGEPLRCAGILAHKLASAATKLDGLMVTVRQELSSGPSIIGLNEALESDAAQQFVSGGRATSATSVELAVSSERGPAETGC